MATGDRFVADGALRDRRAARAPLIDMEGCAPATAAQTAGVSPRLVKAVSGDAGNDVTAMWRDTVASCARP